MDTRRKRNQYEFDKRKYDHIHLQVTKGRKELIQTMAEAAGQSLNGYIVEAVERRMGNANAGGAEEGNE